MGVGDDGCPCLSGRHRSIDFHERFVGMDPRSGRFGDVSILTCRRCGRRWLRYSWENEGFTASGRWGVGVVSPDVAASMTAEAALATLEGLAWYFIGGSYFGGGLSTVRGPGFL